MNKKISSIGAILVTVSVLLFAIFMLVPFDFGCYFVCMILPIGYIMMVAGFCSKCDENRKVAASVGLMFAVIYAVLVFLVYFAQTTAVRMNSLNEQAIQILDYSSGGLFFSYDLLGYGMMALSTFFVGLVIEPKTKSDKWLKWLMIIHGVFFIGCFIMPMTNMFASMGDGGADMIGVIVLEVWCAYFTPIGILSIMHFKRAE